MDKKQKRYCQVCRKEFDVPDMLQTSRNEFFCRECSKTEPSQESQTASSNSQEQLPFVLTRGEGPVGNLMFKDHDAVAFAEQMEKRYAPKTNSKKPILCPYPDCNTYISCFDWSQHFLAEHRNIPVNVIHVDKPATTMLDVNDVRYTISQFLAVFNVFESSESEGDKPVTFTVDTAEVPLTIALLTSRISAYDFYDDHDDESVVVDEREDKRNSFAYCDKIIVWLTSNIYTDLHYSIAVSSKDERIRMKYFGMMRQIGGNDPKTLCQDGQGLVLEEFQVNKLSENGSLPLKLDFVLHKEV